MNSSSSPSKAQIQDDKVFLCVSSIDRNSNASKSVKHDETPAKQNNLALFEMATISTISGTNSPENEKCKKFRKLSQKQRKVQDSYSVLVASPNTSSPWKSIVSDPQCADEKIAADSTDNSKSAMQSEDPTNSPFIGHYVWSSPDKITKKHFKNSKF